MYKRRLVYGIIWAVVVVWPAITVFALDGIPPQAVVLRGPVEPDNSTPAAKPQERGYTGLLNPAPGKSEMVPGDDPLAAFSRRPLEGHFIIPEGGLFLDPLHLDPHFGIDYTNPDLYLAGEAIYVYPIGPGYVTARSECLMCFVDGDVQGRVNYRKPEYNFGWGGLVLVETPYTPDVSIYVLYAHLKRDFVSLGDYVEPEEVIAVAGSSGYSEEIHLHLEVRFGPPGQFWNDDFSQQDTLDHWLATMFANPAVLVFPEYHPSFVTTLAEWVALRPRPAELP